MSSLTKDDIREAIKEALNPIKEDVTEIKGIVKVDHDTLIRTTERVSFHTKLMKVAITALSTGGFGFGLVKYLL